MKRNLILYSVILFSLLMWSCSTGTKKEPVVISGILPDLSGKWVFLDELEVKNLVKRDSTKADGQGKFSFRISLSTPLFFILRDQGANRLGLLVDKNENININSVSGLNDQNLKVEGSPGTILLLEFERFMTGQKFKIDSLAAVFHQNEGEPDFLQIKQRLDSVYVTIMENQREYVMDFINHYPGSLASLLVLNRKLGRNVVLDEEKDFIYFHRVDSALMAVYPDNKHVVDHHRRVKEIRGRMFDRFTADEKLQPGKKAPNIVARDTSNNPAALKSLEGKKVLICFWAGWNAKSRLDNRKIVEYYPKFVKKNIEIFGVSLDENAVIWKGAVRLDRLPGVQVSELKGLVSEAAKDYNLSEQLPFYYLIDQDHKIILKEHDLDKIISHIQTEF